CSIAVTATNLLSQISNSTYSQIAAAYKWNPTTTNWLPLANTETLQAGTVLWLKASTNAMLTVVGTYPEPTNIVVSPGGLFIASAGLEDWASSNVLSVSGSIWSYDPSVAKWLTRPLAALPGLSSLPDSTAPGGAFFSQVSAPVQLAIPNPLLRMRY